MSFDYFSKRRMQYILEKLKTIFDTKADVSDLPTVNDGVLTIQKNGTTVQTFNANSSSNVNANISVPDILVGTSDPSNNLGKDSDIYVKVSIADFGKSFTIRTTSTGMESASIAVDTVIEGVVTKTDSIHYRSPYKTYSDFSTSYGGGQWSVTITSNNVSNRTQGQVISWSYTTSTNFTLTINAPVVYATFVKSRGIWIKTTDVPISTFADLTDTAFNNLQNGQVAIYNNTTGKWENQNLPSSTDIFTITLTVSEDPQTGEVTFTPDKLPSEVIAAKNNGNIIRLVTTDTADYYFDLSADYVGVEDTEFIFTCIHYTSSDYRMLSSGFIFIKDENSDTWASIEAVSSEASESLIIEMEENSGAYSCDVSFSTLDEAYWHSVDMVIDFNKEIFRLAKYDSSEDTFYFSNTIADSNGITTKTFVMVGDESENEWTSISLVESSGGDPNAIKWSEAKTSVKKNYSLPINNCTVNGVTFTTDTKGVINANGTASSSGGRLNAVSNSFMLPAGEYLLSSEISDSNITDSLLTAVIMRASDNSVIRNAVDKRIPFILSEDTLCFMGINVTQNTVYTNVKIKYMIRLSSVADDTYVPYIPDNTELMDWKSNSVLGAKNLINSGFDSWTFNANEDFSKIVGSLYLNVGDKITFSANQNNALTSNTRNLLRILKPNNEYAYEPDSVTTNYHLAAGLHKMEFTATVAGTHSFVIWVHTPNVNVTYSQFMVRLASDTDDTYQLFAMTNRQLTAKVEDLDYHLDQTATTSTTDPTTYTFTDARITSNSVIDVYADIFGVSPSSVAASAGTCTVTFPKQDSAQSMTCRIYIK